MIVHCPTCHKPVKWSQENPYRPFCCERCKLIDLGEWASDSYVIEDNDENPQVSRRATEAAQHLIESLTKKNDSQK